MNVTRQTLAHTTPSAEIYRALMNVNVKMVTMATVNSAMTSMNVLKKMRVKIMNIVLTTMEHIDVYLTKVST